MASAKISAMNNAWVVVFSALLASTSVFAKPRIAVLPFPGPQGGMSRGQLLEELCATADCVAPEKVTTAGRPDWRKAKKERVNVFVVGKATKVKAKRTLDLKVLKGAGAPKFHKVYVLDAKGRLDARTLPLASAAIAKVSGASAPGAVPVPPVQAPDPEAPPAEAVSPTPSPRGRPESEPLQPEEEGRSARTGTDRKRRESESDERSARAAAERKYRDPEADGEAPSHRGRVLPPLLVVEVGPEVMNRNMAYTNQQTANLRSYRADLIPGPHLKLELYPLAYTTESFLSGLGLEGGYFFAIGLKTRRADDPPYATSFSRLDAALRLNLHPMEALTVTPRVGFRNTQFSLGAAADGSTLNGVPAIAYSALQLGLLAEFALSEGKYRPFLGFTYLPVLSTGEIGSADFFPRAKAAGIEGTLGIGFQLSHSFELRAAAQITRYTFQFNAQPGDAYQADSALDSYLGGMIALRWSI